MSEAICLLQSIAIMIASIFAIATFAVCVAILHDFIHIYLPRKRQVKMILKDIAVYLRSEKKECPHEHE